MKRLSVNHWCVLLALSAGALAAIGCTEDAPEYSLQGRPGPFRIDAGRPRDAGADSGMAGAGMAGAGMAGAGGSGMGGTPGQGGSGNVADASTPDTGS